MIEIRFERRALSGLAETEQALVIVPALHSRIGREQLVPGAEPTSGLDDAIADAVGRESASVRVTIFRGTASDGRGSWGFAHDLDPDEMEAIAREIVRAQLHAYRRLFLAGVCMHVRIDLGSREQLAFRRANYEVRRELELSLDRLTGAARELAELDIWLLRNFVFFFAVSVERLLESTLGGNSTAVRMRIKRAGRTRECLSKDALRELAA